MSFNLPSNVDDFFYFQLLIFFLIGFMINVYTNGQATLIFIEEEYNFNPMSNYTFDNLTFNQHSEEQIIQKYSKSVSWKSKLALNVALVLYWLISPLVNFYYSFFVKIQFEEKPKDLNS